MQRKNNFAKSLPTVVADIIYALFNALKISIGVRLGRSVHIIKKAYFRQNSTYIIQRHGEESV